MKAPFLRFLNFPLPTNQTTLNATAAKFNNLPSPFLLSFSFFFFSQISALAPRRASLSAAGVRPVGHDAAAAAGPANSIKSVHVISRQQPRHPDKERKKGGRRKKGVVVVVV